jgi:uncharacterized membrane protein
MGLSLYAEIALTAATFAILFGYQVLNLVEAKRRPMSTSLGFNSRARDLWVRSVIRDKRDILAVQTLRNWTIAATFLASTAIVLALGFLNFALTSEGLSELAHKFNLFGSTNPTLLVAKALTSVNVFLFTFFNFTLAVRAYNHAAFLINVPEGEDAAINPDTVVGAINRGAHSYNLGMRGYYVAVPVTLWVLGPTWFFFSSLIVTYAVHRLEHKA